MSDLDDDAVLLSRLGPGLPGVATWAWNEFAFELGRRVLVELAKQPGAAPHVIEAASSGLAAVGAAESLMSNPKEGLETVAMIEATLRPMATLAGSSAAALLLRLFLWGTRRIRSDRRVADALATLAAEACNAHADLAALGGLDAEAARQAERAAQLADARALLAGKKLVR